jgi:serine/threonine-protein kinase HipA
MHQRLLLRRHFMTRRFDPPDDGGRLHVQTLGALEHISYNEPGTYTYERALLLMRRLGLGTPAVEQQFRRMVFNVVARNQDDHVKNIAFVMDRQGAWSLAPAYDVTWAYGKRDAFTVTDLRVVERLAGLKRGRAAAILDEVRGAVTTWPVIAAEAGVREDLAEEIARSHRLQLPPG